MATATQISLSEYLHTSYRPDVEYIDGELKERNVGQFEHSRLEMLLGAWFISNQGLWNAIALADQRIRVSSNQVRIPDVCLVPHGATPDVLTEPPILVIEILSPDDTYSDLQSRCGDYRLMGVQAIWIIDPQNRSARVGTGAAWVESRRLEVPGTAIYVELDQLFADLDRSRVA